MTDYRVIYDDPDYPDEPTAVLAPSENWMKIAMEGDLPPVSVFWKLQDAEQKAIQEGRHATFEHDKDDYEAQWDAPRIGPLTEQQAIEYVCMKDLPRRCWAEKHNRPMFRIVHKDQIPDDRSFRNAWEMI